MKPKTQRALEIVVEKARKLAANSFVRQVQNRSVRYSWKEGEDIQILEEGLPTQESLDAFVLNFRFFIQDNEPSSFSRLSGLLDDEDVSDSWKNGFAEARKWVNSYLDSRPAMSFSLDGYSPRNHREIMEVCVYGGIAHSKKRCSYQLVMEDREMGPYLGMLFHDILGNLFGAIFYVANLSAQELGQAPITIPTRADEE